MSNFPDFNRMLRTGEIVDLTTALGVRREKRKQKDLSQTS